MREKEDRTEKNEREKRARQMRYTTIATIVKQESEPVCPPSANNYLHNLLRSTRLLEDLKERQRTRRKF